MSVTIQQKAIKCYRSTKAKSACGTQCTNEWLSSSRFFTEHDCSFSKPIIICHLVLLVNASQYIVKKRVKRKVIQNPATHLSHVLTLHHLSFKLSGLIKRNKKCGHLLWCWMTASISALEQMGEKIGRKKKSSSICSDMLQKHFRYQTLHVYTSNTSQVSIQILCQFPLNFQFIKINSWWHIAGEEGSTRWQN